MVVVECRERYCLLITAFYFEKDHSLQNKIRKYNIYKAESALQSKTQSGTPSTLVDKLLQVYHSFKKCQEKTNICSFAFCPSFLC